MKNETFIFLGISGSGKGTQKDLVKERLQEKNGQFSMKIIYTEM